MQIWKYLQILVFLWKQCPENFVFLIVGILELFTCNVCEIFFKEYQQTLEYVKK